VSVAYLITHPEVVVDAEVPVPRWYLSDKGIHRMRAFATGHDPGKLSAVWASPETKAIEAAGILAAQFGLPVPFTMGCTRTIAVQPGFFHRPSLTGWQMPSSSGRRRAWGDGSAL
jgi:broad specificity phosphatase PhoE